jgi:AcrR family transcriptional regulator
MQSDLATAVKRAPERDRRQEILAAAERAFVRHGFHAATMLHVAEEAGMSAGNLYRYFPGKEALVEGLCTMDSEERAANFAMLARSPRVFDAIASGLGQHLLAKPPEKARIALEIWSEVARNDRMAAIGRGVDAEIMAGLLSVFEAAKANGEAVATLDSAFAARVLFTLVGGLFKRLALEANFNVAAETAMLMGVLRALFDGGLRPGAMNENGRGAH